MRKKNKNISDITVKDVKNYFKDRAENGLLVKLMNEFKIGSVYHEPRPRMFNGSKLAFEINQDMESKKLAYLNARYDLLKKAYLEDSRFIETNNQFAFFMDVIAEILLNRINE